jgi:hypothetical protein
MTPRIAILAADGAELDPVQAVAARLWAGQAGVDPEGVVAKAAEKYWRAHGGDDGYWSALGQPMACGRCGETYKLENLSVCPNCFALACSRHDRLCACGQRALG